MIAPLVFGAVAVVVVSAIVGAGVTLWLTYMRLIELLRTQHPATWQALGSPSLAWTAPAASIDSRQRTNRFIVGGKFRELGDPQVSRLAGRYRFILAAFMSVAVLAMASVLVWMFLRRFH